MVIKNVDLIPFLVNIDANIKFTSFSNRASSRITTCGSSSSYER